jgi:hypothetical protein
VTVPVQQQEHLREAGLSPQEAHCSQQEAHREEEADLPQEEAQQQADSVHWS